MYLSSKVEKKKKVSLFCIISILVLLTLYKLLVNMAFRLVGPWNLSRASVIISNKQTTTNMAAMVWKDIYTLRGWPWICAMLALVFANTLKICLSIIFAASLWLLKLGQRPKSPGMEWKEMTSEGQVTEKFR